MIWVGIDDTDMPDTPGTNQLARRLAHVLASRYRCLRIVRHQLFANPNVPCTSQNGSASLWLQPRHEHDRQQLLATLRHEMRAWYVIGSDPGLCLAEGTVPDAVQEFGQLAQRQIVTQQQARALAQSVGLHLEGLGGTEGGVIGALAAIGLAATGDDGRVVHLEGWHHELTGIVSVPEIESAGAEVRCLDSDQRLSAGTVDLVKKLRPNCRRGAVVLYVAPTDSPQHWLAQKIR